MPRLTEERDGAELARSNASSAPDAAIVSRSLELPDGYQHFGWFTSGAANPHGVTLNSPLGLANALGSDAGSQCYFYTSHQIYYEGGLLKQTRSSPNWEGGMVTYATCKHLMRSTSKPSWDGIWIATVGPKDCADNCLVCVGKIWKSFPSNYTMRGCIKESYPSVFSAKCADTNPRGDLYTPKRSLYKPLEVFDHNNFNEPPRHTRSVDFYKKSPGSVSEREDGLIPKWWRDMEYFMHGKHPPVFILSPCWIFSEPMMWSTANPGRAALKMTAGSFAETLYG